MVVDDDATDDQIANAGVRNMLERFRHDPDAFYHVKEHLLDNLDTIVDDTEVPYEPSYDFPGQFGYHSKQKQSWKQY